ncbi:MAG: phosphotransferase [Bacteroidota bacterium]
MDLRTRFQQELPNCFFLENSIAPVASYLAQQNWLQADEVLQQLEKPGEGNMNFVLRAITNQRSFILKQARPWVEKFPQIDAPVERVAVEAQFFQSLAAIPTISQYAPTCLGFDAQSHILYIEDLGEGVDYGFLYQKNQVLSTSALASLIQYLTVLHQIEPPADFPENLAMRQLNHEHIFNFPYSVDNGFNLDDVQEGLQTAAMPYKTDAVLKAKIKTYGELYLTKGQHLLHGDFYPGSWLATPNGLKVIDPEFGFVGPAEFDLGVLLAHLYISQQSEATIQSVVSEYQKVLPLRESVLAVFTGIEILRRLIGIAQLPLSLELSEKKGLMEQARAWILEERFS